MNGTYANMDGYGYGGGNMASSGPSMLPPPLAPGSQGKVLLEAYRKDIMNGFEADAPRFNPVCRPSVRTASVCQKLTHP
jgi:hypothetical protein